MPVNRNTQRRHQQRDDDRRGHPLQHRDRRHPDEGWADRGTWTNLQDDANGTSNARHGSRESHGRRSRDDSPVQQRAPGERHQQSTQRSDAAGGFGSDPQGDDNPRNTPDRAPGGGRRTSAYKSQGNPRTGSQGGDDSNQGIAGHPGQQFGDLHGPRPSDAAAAGYHDDDQFGGRRGRSTNDRRYGSRRGHGSERREDPRVRDQR